MIKQAQFRIGQIVEHNKFGYRGVIYEVDPSFSLTEEWYDSVARSRPPKDRPWYHVLVDNELHTTYVAERNLSPATDKREIHHPLINEFFLGYREGMYQPKHVMM
jgi:heat shock protein HspQ